MPLCATFVFFLLCLIKIKFLKLTKDQENFLSLSLSPPEFVWLLFCRGRGEGRACIYFVFRVVDILLDDGADYIFPLGAGRREAG